MLWDSLLTVFHGTSLAALVVLLHAQGLTTTVSSVMDTFLVVLA